jgi:hypothetical protein
VLEEYRHDSYFKDSTCCSPRFLLTGHRAAAFDTETHAAIAKKAFDSSVLGATGPGSVVNLLGIDRLNASSLNYTPFALYWYSSPASQFPTYYGDYVTQPEAFERCQMREFLPDSIPAAYQILKLTHQPPDTA